jgi:hypothetical protein
LSLKKWTLSNVICTTCFVPLPSLQPFAVSVFTEFTDMTDFADGTCDARTGPTATATPVPASSATDPATAAIRLTDIDFLIETSRNHHATAGLPAKASLR